MKNVRRLMLLCAAFVFALPASAQTIEPWLTTDNIGNFFVCIFAGILLAFAFQFLLTNLSIALGITAIGDITDDSDDSAKHSAKNNKDVDDSSGNVGVKVFTGLGVFMTITMSISLFFASMIAVKLSLLPADVVGMTLGIVIWAGFILISLYFDAKIFSSMAGGLMGFVKAGLGAGSTAFSGIFGQSQASQMKDLARETVSAIHDEVRKEFDLSDVESKLDKYVEKLSPQEIDFQKIKKQLADLLHEIEVKEQYTPDDPEASKKLILEISENQPSLSAKDKQNLANVIDDIKASAKAEGSKVDKVMLGIDKLTPGDEAQGHEYREKVEAYLKQTGKSELDPDKLKEDLSKMLDDPKAAPEVLKARISQLDRSSLKALVANMEGMNEQKAESYLAKAESVIEQVRSRIQSMSSQSQDKVNKKIAVTDAEMQRRKANAGSSVQLWFNNMNRPELSYNQVRMDAKRIFDDPSSTPQVLRSRLNRLDRDSMVALLSNNPWIDKQQAEKMADQFEHAKQDVIDKVDSIDKEVKIKLNQAKKEGLKQAEAARKTASAAAWWLFISSVASGGAAAVGGMMALSVF